MLYRGTVQYLIEAPVWVDAESAEEARAKLEAMGLDELRDHLHIDNVLDLHPNDMTEDELEALEYKELE